MPTFACVLRSGGRYTPAWTAALHDAVRRHAPEFDRFVAVTDMETDIAGVERIALRHGWPGWWSKFEAFRSDVAQGDVAVLCDLDTIVAGPLADLATGGLAAMEDWLLPGRCSTALVRWHGAELADLYAAFAADPDGWMEPGSCGDVPNAVHGDQVVVDHLLRRSGRRPASLQAAHPGLIDAYDAARGIEAPLTIFIGDTKPMLGTDGQLRPPVRELSEAA